ncbi:signal recognition particle-docking protein FtsY [Candidatus Aerophobetes bacterium]|uniref:Signal recognition particle receptor FtsY n=1 Tax=Aerophobetes bacterium TaxID=2030807 RepID=A0A2A4YKL6_UNCAE|nr:MAG: signal recognition particle-docking protein FtsY [Candidatus Aerophobetes bacterium]
MFSFLKSGFSKIKKALSKTRSIFSDKLQQLFKKPMSEETLEELERILFEADLGSKCALAFTDKIQKFAKKNPTASVKDYINEMKSYALEILNKETNDTVKEATSARMILIVGVNGSGKTTTCAKLAKRMKDEKKSVLLAAGDTFRAAAIEQLEIWADRLKVDIVKGQPGGDPSSVIFDAFSAAKSRGIDVVIADTAGRLQSKTDLMQELGKVRKVCQKFDPNAPHETLLVLDATTGQNALDQAKIFNEYTPLDGLVLTKLDGSAKGGIILAIREELNIPIKYIGVGESLDDLMPFDPNEYIEALFSS